MLLRHLIVNRPIGTLVACACLAVLGVLAYKGMKVSVLPVTRLPVITVTTELAGTDPEEIETLITRKVEDALSDIPGLVRIQSTSVQGESEVTVHFKLGEDLSAAASEVRTRIRRLRQSFPKDTLPSVITFFNPSDAPLAVLGIGGTASLTDTADWARKKLKPALNRIEGVAAVRVMGAPTREIAVACDPSQLKRLGMTIGNVALTLDRGHKTLPGGSLDNGDVRCLIRTSGNLETCSQIAELPILIGDQGNPLTVGALANVHYVDELPKEITRCNGRSLVTVAVFGTSDADPSTVWAGIQKTVEDLRISDHGKQQIQAIYSQAEVLDKALGRLKLLLLLSAGTAGCVLFLFLGSLTPTLIVATSIPFSVFVTLLLMLLFGIPLDLLSFSGLVLSVGMVVDNGIVVTESISRRLGAGQSHRQAIMDGTYEVAPALCFSTLTAVVAFVPLVFVSKETRVLYAGLTYTVSLGMLASLAAALVLVPVLVWYCYRPRQLVLLRFGVYFDRPQWYERFLKALWERPGMVAMAALFCLAAVAALIPSLSFRSGGALDQKDFQVILVMPPGTARENTDAQSQTVEQAAMGLEGVKRVYARVWANQARIKVMLDEDRSDQSPAQAMELLQQRLPGQGPAQLHFMPAEESADHLTISLSVFGENLEKLNALQTSVRESLAQVPGIREVIVGQGNPVPAVEFRVRHDRLGFHGIEAQDLATQVRQHLTGPVATRVFSGERRIQVRVKASRHVKEGFKPLESTFVQSTGGQLVALTELISPTYALAPSELHRENRRRAVRLTLVFGDVDPIETGRRLQEKLSGLPTEAGYRASLGDEIDKILCTRKEMTFAAALAVLLTYLVMVSVTESFLLPFIVVSAVPFAAAGVIAGSIVIGFPFTRPVYMGMIMLCGLVINVNVLMIVAMNQERDSGARAESAALRGASRRLRPAVMTTLTAICGCLPILLDRGTGSDMWSPFALTLACGLTGAALASFILTPGLYVLATRAGQGERKRLLRSQGNDATHAFKVR